MRCLSAALLAVAVAAPAAAASAQDDDGSRLRWRDEWSRAHPLAYTAAPLAAGLTLVLDQALPPSGAGWTGGILGDDEVTDALGERDARVREQIATVSDYLLLATAIHPLVDAWAVVGLGDANSDVAWQLTAVTLETYAVAFILNAITKRVVARERPAPTRECTADDRVLDPERCADRGGTRSFYSGHAAGAFTTAGLTCINHGFLRIYGSPEADAFACGVSLLNATAISVLRVMALRHYLSDVIVGALVGLATGLLVPYLLHYGLRPAGVPEEEGTGAGEAPLHRPVVLPLAAGTF